MLRYAFRSMAGCYGIILSACGGGDAVPCLATEIVPYRDTTCYAAVGFAARDSASLIPSQEDIDLYYDRLKVAVAAEPLLYNITPQAYRNVFYGEANLSSTNATVIDAWKGVEGPAPLTGDTMFDAVMADLVTPVLVRPGQDVGNQTFQYKLDTQRMFNEELLAARLAPTSTTLPDPAVLPWPDATWHWLDPIDGAERVAEIDFTAGFGDCVSGCAIFHYFRADVPSVGEATVFDLGGDPLPPGVQLSPNTKPPP